LIQSIQDDENIRKKIGIRKIEEDESNYFVKFRGSKTIIIFAPTPDVTIHDLNLVKRDSLSHLKDLVDSIDPVDFNVTFIPHESYYIKSMTKALDGTALLSGKSIGQFPTRLNAIAITAKNLP